MGFHVVNVVDAGVKVDENYRVYTEGRQRDLYCKAAQGDDSIKMLSGRASVSSPILPTRRREPGGESNTGHYSTPALREFGPI